MPGSAALIWGLVNNEQWLGRTASQEAALLYSTGWNPVLTQQAFHASLPPSDDGRCAAPQQVAVGWKYTLLLLSDGRAGICETCDLHSCKVDAKPPKTSQSRPALDYHVLWKLLQFPAPLQLQHTAVVPAAARQVIQVAAGDDHCLLLTSAGSVWAWGANRYGQVGCSDARQQHSSVEQHQHQPDSSAISRQHQQQFEPVASQGARPRDEGLEQHNHSSRPARHSLSGAAALETAQALLLVLGPGATDSMCHEPIAQVAAGACHSLAVTAQQGQLFTWGWNAHGQCCTGTTTDVLQPQLCSALDGVPLASASGGLAHTMCVSRDGAVYACGWNSHGQLGIAGNAGAGKEAAGGSWSTEEVGGGSSAQGAQSAGQTGTGLQRQQQMSLLQQQQQQLCVSCLQPQLVEHPELDQEHVVQIACGSRHTVVLTASGSVFAWGWNKYKQCCSAAEADSVLQATRVDLDTGPPFDQAADQQQQMGTIPAVLQRHACINRRKAAAVYAGKWHSCIVLAL